MTRAGRRTRGELDQEIDELLARARIARAKMPRLSARNTVEERAERARIGREVDAILSEVASRRPPPPPYPEGTGIWRILDD